MDYKLDEGVRIEMNNDENLGIPHVHAYLEKNKWKRSMMSFKSNCIQIYWTCGCMEEAKRLSQQLVEKGMVACANLIPHVESYYMWEGAVEIGHEVKVIFKTVNDRFEEVKNYLLHNALYSVPEILKIEIADGNPGYLEWVASCTKPA